MTLDNATNGIAAAAVTSPLWLPSLQDVSGVASQVVPIFGALWLVVQIVAKVTELLRKDKPK